MKLSVLKASCLLASAGILSAVSAQAATYNFGTLTPAPNTQTIFDNPGSISDALDFTISSLNPNASLSGVTLTLPSPVGGNIYNITGFSGVIDDSLLNPVGTLSLVGSNYVFTGALTPGNYSLNISGVADGSSGGVYFVSMAAAPVPEASAALSAIAGLGLLALVARRHREI